MIEQIRGRYIGGRLKMADTDFLNFEETESSKEDLERILHLLKKTNCHGLPNPYNSILLWVTGLSDEFDHQLGRGDTIGGSPPDVDLDFDTVNHHKMVEWIVERYGRDSTANIITYGTFKPKSIFDSLYRATEGDPEELAQIKKLIPPPKQGKEPTIEEVGEANPLLATQHKQIWGWANKLAGMVKQFGVHAAGVVVCDDPIADHLPIWKNKDFERITQFDKDEVEALGLIKFDLQPINTQ